MRVIRHGDHPVEVWREGVRTRMHVSALTGARQLCIFEQWVEPGRGAATHVHDVEEVLTVIEGQARITLGEEDAIVEAGQSVVVPARQPHGFTNGGTGPLHLQAILAAPYLETIFTEAETVRRWTGRD